MARVSLPISSWEPRHRRALGSLANEDAVSPRRCPFAAALLSQQLAGGDVALLMRRVAAAAAERDRMASDARAATAQARFTGLLVVAMPTGAALFAELIEPGFVGRVLSDPVASVLVLFAASCFRRLGSGRFAG